MPICTDHDLYLLPSSSTIPEHGYEDLEDTNNLLDSEVSAEHCVRIDRSEYEQLPTLQFEHSDTLFFIAETDPIDYSIFEHREPKMSTCPRCGGSLPLTNVNHEGLVECLYCNTFTYV